jgi:hypothetical protein
MRPLPDIGELNLTSGNPTLASKKVGQASIGIAAARQTGGGDIKVG